MDFVFDTRQQGSGGGGGDGVTNVGTGTGLTGGPITTTGVISLAPVNAGFILANLTGSSAVPLPHSVSTVFDSVFDNTQGDILYRNASGWTFLAPGTSGQVLVTGGAGANPGWAGGTGGTVTSIATNNGITGGPITTTGTIGLAAIASGDLLANISGISASPSAVPVTTLFDSVFGNTQGYILYRNATVWTHLAPGTAGQILQTGGPAANPSWVNSGGGSVTSIATNNGITGGTITTTGTIGLAAIANHFILANLSGSSAAPIPHSVSDLFDNVFTSTQGSILYRNNTTWSYLTPGTAGNFLRTNGVNQNPSWAVASGGGSSFPYVNTLWSAQNGDDTNDGTSIDTPKLTPAGIAAAIIPGQPTVWNIEDDGVYIFTGSVTLTGPLYINAPAATLQWGGTPSDTMFILNGVGSAPLQVTAGSIVLGNDPGFIFATGQSSIIVNCPAVINRGQMWVDSSSSPNGVPLALFNLNITNPTTHVDFVFGYTGKQIINAQNLGQGQITSRFTSGSTTDVCQVNAQFYNGNLNGTGDFDLTAAKLGSNFSVTTSSVINLNVAKSDNDIRTLSGNFSGFVGYVPVNTGPFLFRYNNFFKPISLVNQPILGELYNVYFTSTGTSFSFSPGSSGNARDGSNQQIQLPFVNGTIVLPDAVLNTLPAGYRFTAAQSVPSGALVQASGSDTISGQNSVGPGATTCYTGIGICEFVVGPSNGAGGVAWIVENCYASNTIFQGQNIAQTINSPALTFTNLASAGIVPIITAARGTSQYQISNIFLNGVGGTNFAGIGGNRNLAITDGTNVYTVIPAATLLLLINSGWGSVAVPYPVAVAINQASATGANIYAQYSGGTTDYTAGSVVISLVYERVTF